MQLFLSHAAEDARIASVLKQLIERCSFNKASVWFSSDTSPTGGVTPGGPWFDQLVGQINTSVAFLALVTPTSVANLWLHYEAGCAATKGIPIVPIVAGVSVNDVRLPLSLYNAHNVAQPEGLKTFLMRLCQAHGIEHDETMLETPIQQAVKEITTVLSSHSDGSPSDQEGNDKVLRLIDRRFMELFERLPQTPEARQMPTFSVSAVVTKKGSRV